MSDHDEIFEENKNPAATSRWIPIGNGWVTASGAPSKERLVGWARKGVTDVVTLQRDDERQPWLAEVCHESGMRWHGYPLSGRHLAGARDMATVARISELLPLFESHTPPSRVVVHCAAGMHRTGLCLYLLLRHVGLEPAEVVSRIRRARPITGEELCRVTKGGVLEATAEALFQRFATRSANGRDAEAVGSKGNQNPPENLATDAHG